MPDVEVEEIAALFQPPDCGMLDFSIQYTDDPDEIAWRGWLADLTKPMKALNETLDDPNDEDFNYMEELADEEVSIFFANMAGKHPSISIHPSASVGVCVCVYLCM